MLRKIPHVQLVLESPSDLSSSFFISKLQLNAEPFKFFLSLYLSYISYVQQMGKCEIWIFRVKPH